MAALQTLHIALIEEAFVDERKIALATRAAFEPKHFGTSTIFFLLLTASRSGAFARGDPAPRSQLHSPPPQRGSLHRILSGATARRMSGWPEVLILRRDLPCHMELSAPTLVRH